MRFSLSEQLIAGAWLSLAVAYGLLSRSASSAFALMGAGAVFTLPIFASRGARSPRGALRLLSRAVLAAFAVFMVVMVLATVERVYLVNGDSYPAWLASGRLGKVTDGDIEQLRRTSCSHDPIEVLQKKGYVVLRCGFAWYEPSTKTYIADSYAWGATK
jgi:hypothetical protein